MNQTPIQQRRFPLNGRALIPLMIVGLGILLTGCPALLNQPPIASSTGSPLQGEAPLTVDFDASGSSDPDGTITSFDWDFDDGDTATGQTPSHTFESEGTFQVTLTVTDNQGSKATDSLVVTVGKASIFFSSDRTTNDDIFRMETDGANQAQVTSNSDSDIFPALLPSTRDKLAFASDRDTANYDLFTSQPDGTLPVNQTGGQTASQELQPSWDPSGDQLAFASDLDHVGNFYGVYTFNFGSGLISTVSVQSGSQTLSPSWSPTGNRIAFASNRDGDYELFTINPDGSSQEKLTDNTDDDGFDGSLLPGSPLVPDARGISWSPDGNRLAFISDRNGNLDVFVVNVDGTGLEQLTTHTADDYDPFWLPNGEEIAFVSDRDGNPQIYKINVNTRAVTSALTTIGTNVNPAGTDHDAD